MKIVPAIVSLSATANPYLNADGMLNFEKVSALYEQLKAKAGEVVPSSYFVISRKAKPAKYSSVLERKNDLRYTTRRATKLAQRKRLGTDWQARVKVLMADWTIVPEAGLTAVQKANTKAAARAIAAHLKKITTVKAKVTKVRAGAKADQAKVFTSSIKLLQGALSESVKEQDIVTARTMFGTSMIVKLGPDNYVSVSPSDADKFRAAKKAMSSESSSSESATGPAHPVAGLKANYPNEFKFCNAVQNVGMSLTPIASREPTYEVAEFSEGALLKAMKAAGWESQGKDLFPDQEGYFFVQRKGGEELAVFEVTEDGVELTFSGY